MQSGKCPSFLISILLGLLRLGQGYRRKLPRVSGSKGGLVQ